VIDFPNQPRQTIGNNYEIPANLQYLSLINNRLSVIEKLEPCTQLVHLCLRQNAITGQGLGGLDAVAHTLIKLDLYENQIDGSSLSEYLTGSSNGTPRVFPNLRYLDLSFNPVRQLQTIKTDEDQMTDTESVREGGPLAAVPNLEYLFFVECKMKQMPPFQALPKLRCLELGGNRLRTIERLGALQGSLEELWLGKNKIVTIENLPLPNLRILSLQANRIVKMEGLGDLTSLTQLYLAENGIEVIEGLDALVNLTILDLDKNRVNAIQGLDKLTKLEELWLSSNQISSFDEVAKLAGFAHLDTVSLQHNPIYKDPQYRNKVLAALTQINQLDALPVMRGNNPILQAMSNQ